MIGPVDAQPSPRRARGEAGGIDHGAAARRAGGALLAASLPVAAKRPKTAGDAAAKPKTPPTPPDAGSATESQDALAQERQLATVARQQRAFNFVAMERAELQREQETMDTLMLAQLKHDAEVLKEWIREA